MAENSDSLLDSTSPEYFVELNPVDGSVAGQEALHARPQEEILEDCGFRAIDLLARTGANPCSVDPFSPGFQGELDLQLFAAEDEGRTEEPSERRKREEREKGNVPKSQDLAGSAILIGGVLILFFFGTYIVQRIGELFARYFGLIATQGGVFGIEELQVLMKDLFLQTGMILAPILIVTILMGVLGNVVQVGLMFSLQTLEFKLERLIPDFKRVLPVRRNIFNLLKVIAQMLIIAGAAYLVVVDDFIPMLKSGGMGLTQAVVVFATVAFKLLLLCGVLLLILSIPDYFYQRFEYIENLKITTAEAKRERKDEEGDPLLKQRQRERAYEMRRQRNMLSEVPEADVVITNPTHYAVALKYDQIEAMAPVVIAKGVDQLAFSIRTVAKEHRIPIEENPLLARTLYRDVELGQEIPAELYRAVSVIFSRLQKFRERQGA
ncbi:MAG: EscU/YscU/HrcU family type III secretion system export apparatus switch protein [Leptospiraceae bacterium]|nr:EscU/YscU/HrcU family type III secretion system export apparatus switch protein [Leptospiraceae bacterium]